MSDFANERTCVCGETFIADGFDMCDDCLCHEETCEFADNCDHPSHQGCTCTEQGMCENCAGPFGTSVRHDVDTRPLAQIRDSIKFPTRW